MRVLFFLEPVIFRSQPKGVSAHFFWVECVRRSVASVDGAMALAANADVCEAWAQNDSTFTSEVACYSLNAFDALAPFDFERSRYTKALFDHEPAANPLTDELKFIRGTFRPDLVVMTAQNAIACHAWDGLPVLYIEQAPLPRLGHPIRTMLDPGGQQAGSLLERHADRIKHLPLSDPVRQQAERLLEAVKRSISTNDPRAFQAQAALSEMKREGSVALLVTQPVDAVTYEGAYHSVELENLLYAWAEALPAGWIGVPTYHPGQRLSDELEVALSRASGRLRFLPQALSQGMTEPLLTVADGMVTISSTSAMTALLLGKRVVVTGQSPLQGWCVNDPSRLHEARPLTADEATSTFCFLTNRYVQGHEALMEQPGRLVDVMRVVTRHSDPAAWFLDPSSWTLKDAAALFHLPFCFSNEGAGETVCIRRALESRLATLEEEGASLKEEWKAAVSQRDRLDGELQSARSERDAVRAEYGAAVADRDRLLGELANTVRELDQLSANHRGIAADRDRLGRELAIATVRGDALGAESTAALVKLRQLQRNAAALAFDVPAWPDADEGTERTQGRGQALETTSELASAVPADHALLLAQLSVAGRERTRLAAAAAAVEADRDRLARELAVVSVRADALGSECATVLLQARRLEREVSEVGVERRSLEDRLGASVAERDRIDAEARTAHTARLQWEAAHLVATAETERLRRELEAVQSAREEAHGELQRVLNRANAERLEWQCRLDAAAIDSATVARLQAELRTVADECDVLRQQRDAAAFDLDRLNCRISDMEGQQAGLQSALDASHADMTTLQARSDVERAALESLQREREDTASLLRSIASERDGLADALVVIRGERDRAVDIGDRLEQKIDFDSTVQRQRHTDHEEVVAARDALLRQLTNAQSQRDAARDAWMSTIADRGRVTRRLFEAMTERDLSQSGRAAVIAERDRMSRRLAGEIGVREELERSLQALGERLEDRNSDVQATRRASTPSLAWRLTARLRRLRQGSPVELPEAFK